MYKLTACLVGRVAATVGLQRRRSYSSKLFVKGLSFSTTEDMLAQEFSHFGKVIQANIVMDKRRNRSKGFGYVSFEREEDAQKALLEMNGKLLHGRLLYVDEQP